MLQLLGAALQCCPDTTEIKEATPQFTWLKDLPFQVPSRKVLQFTCTRETLPLLFECFEAQNTLTILCRSLSVTLDPQRLVQFNLDILEANSEADYIDVTLILRGGPILVTIARLYSLTCSPEVLASALDSIKAHYLRTSTSLKEFPMPQEIANRVKSFFHSTGFRNIRTDQKVVQGYDRHTVLVFVMLEDTDEMPAPTRTFPLRFEISTQVSIRIWVSSNNAIANFPLEGRTNQDELVEGLNVLLPDHKYEWETKKLDRLGEKRQLHLTRTLSRSHFRSNDVQILNSLYQEAIQTLKWTVLAAYTHYVSPQLPVQECLDMITPRNPSKRTEDPRYFTLPRNVFDSLCNFLNRERWTYFFRLRDPLQVGEIAEIQETRLLDYISISEAIQNNPADRALYLASAIQLSRTAQQGSISFPIDAFSANKQTRHPAALFPSSELLSRPADCLSHSLVAANQLLSSTGDDPLYLRLSGDGFRLQTRHSKWLLTGTHCGRRVRLMFCPREVLADPQLPAYLMELGNLEQAEEVLGIMDFEGVTYIMHSYPACSQLTREEVIRLAALLLDLHRRGLYHGFLSFATFTISADCVSLVFPCLRPSYFPLLAQLLNPERLNFLLDPRIAPMQVYGIEPLSSELEAADCLAVSLLAQQYCLRDIPMRETVEKLLSELESGRSSLASVVEGLGAI